MEIFLERLPLNGSSAGQRSCMICHLEGDQ